MKSAQIFLLFLILKYLGLKSEYASGLVKANSLIPFKTIFPYFLRYKISWKKNWLINTACNLALRICLPQGIPEIPSGIPFPIPGIGFPGGMCPPDGPKRPEYMIVEKKLNWMEAHVNCKMEGYDLTTVEDMQELIVLQQLIASSTLSRNDYIWTAGNDLFREGSFTWVSTGESIAAFLPVGPGNIEPTGMDEEHCVFLYYEQRLLQFSMADFYCTNLGPSICKRFVPVPDP